MLFVLWWAAPNSGLSAERRQRRLMGSGADGPNMGFFCLIVDGVFLSGQISGMGSGQGRRWLTWLCEDRLYLYLCSSV